MEVLKDEAMLRERAFAMDLDDLHLLLKAFNRRGTWRVLLRFLDLRICFP